MPVTPSTPWPDSLFAAPILRGLDAAARSSVVEAGRLRELAAGERVFDVDELGDSFFVVARGEIELAARTRADLDHSTSLRMVFAGETFGEEATLPGGRRRTEARARTAALVAEIPAPLFVRALGRSGGDAREAPEQRLLRRRATADLLRQIELSSTLGETDFELLLDAAEHHAIRRGDQVYARGDRADGLWLIVHGLVQLQTDDPIAGIAVRAYLSDGDFFGDAELHADDRRALTAVAGGETQLLRVPPAAVRSLVDRNPSLVGRLRRITQTRDARQAAAVEAAPHATRHVFADLYRMQMARSLLTIDQDACVRCGHCAWSCEQVHGVARLVRRGDKIVTGLRVVGGNELVPALAAAAAAAPAPRELLLPNSCQHCKDPVCMLDCPTGAIGREPEGEVWIRESLCTGCGNCAKACPWENIRMAPRVFDGAPERQLGSALIAAAERRGIGLAQMFPEVATKCDLCREYEAPACVQACPTEAIIRLEPERDFAEVAAMLGRPLAGSGLGSAPAIDWARVGLQLAVAGSATLGLATIVAALGLHARAALSPAAGLGWVAGLLAALIMLGLVAHAIPKRAVRSWMRPKQRDGSAARAQLAGASGAASLAPIPRSKLRPFYLAHLALGFALPGLLLAHTGPSLPANGAGILALLTWMTLALGLFGAAVYAVVPRRLTRLEHGGALPEDLLRERERLLDRLQRELSGKSNTLKQLTAERLLPWTGSGLGRLTLLASGRSLADERAQLRAQIEAWLPAEVRDGAGHPHARAEALAGLDALLRTCVELRALPLRRVLTAALRGWLAPHVLLTGALLVALAVHVLTMTVLAVG